MSDTPTAGGPLVPVQTQTVTFYGDDITGVLVQPGTSPATWYVPLRPLCEYLGLDWASQWHRTQRDPVLGAAVISVVITTTEKPGRGQGRRALVCLPLEYLPGWLFGINASRVKDDTLATKITRYRRECFQVLWSAFQTALLPPLVPSDPRLAELAQQIDALTGTLAFLREHLTDLATAASTIAAVSGRLDQAVTLLESLTGQQAALTTRQAVTEAQVEQIDERTQHLTPAHRRQVQTFVEHMVDQTRALPQPLSYSRIYSRIKYRYRVGTFSEVPDEAFDGLMAYLRDELRGATRGDVPEQGHLF